MTGGDRQGWRRQGRERPRLVSCEGEADRPGGRWSWRGGTSGSDRTGRTEGGDRREGRR